MFRYHIHRSHPIVRRRDYAELEKETRVQQLIFLLALPLLWACFDDEMEAYMPARSGVKSHSGRVRDWLYGSSSRRRIQCVVPSNNRLHTMPIFLHAGRSCKECDRKCNRLLSSNICCLMWTLNLSQLSQNIKAACPKCLHNTATPSNITTSSAQADDLGLVDRHSYENE